MKAILLNGNRKRFLNCFKSVNSSADLLVSRFNKDENGEMGIREDCRHYSSRTLQAGEIVQRCRIGCNEEMPFGCPDGCLFFEERHISDAGWNR